MRKIFKMASVSRCRLSLISLQKSTSSLTRKSRNCLAQATQYGIGQPCSNSGTRTICGSVLQQKTKSSIVGAVSKSFTSQMSRSFHQKFPPVLACNPISLAVVENLIGASELEESSEGEDEATSGRKRIRSRHLLDDDP